MKLRAPGRQSDDQTADHLQAKDQGPETGSVQRRLLRVDRQWQADVLETGHRQVPRRTVPDRSTRIREIGKDKLPEQLAIPGSACRE